MWRMCAHFKQAIILCIVIKNIFTQNFKVINIDSWNANKHINNFFSYTLRNNILTICFMVLIIFYKFTLRFHNWNVQTIYMSTNHIQTKFTKNDDNKRSNWQTKNKRSRLMSKVLKDHVCFGSTWIHKPCIKNFDDKKVKQGFYLSQIGRKKFDNPIY
jgi:hypothetical protein